MNQRYITEFNTDESVDYEEKKIYRVDTKTGIEMECSDCKGIERLVKAPPGRLNGSLVIEKGCR